jgi:hypothetical protein
MAFFLHKHDEDPSKTDTKPTYHGKKERFFDSLEFDGMTLDVENRQTGRTTKKRVGKALSYYAFRPSEEGGAKYERYNYRTHGKTLFPYQAPFHTVSKQGRDWFGSVTYPENAQKARGFSENDVQLCWASLYVLANGTFHLAHADDFHSWAAGGAGVAAAGLIAGDKGKVVAIDNASGHYAPNWRQLRQAVQLIANNGAFAPNGVVGLVYKYDLPSGEAFNSAVLRWMDFLRLCHVIQDRGRRMQTWDAITSQYPSLPAIADRASGTLAVHKRVWEKHNFTWEKVGEDLFDYVDSQ